MVALFTEMEEVTLPIQVTGPRPTTRATHPNSENGGVERDMYNVPRLTVESVHEKSDGMI